MAGENNGWDATFHRHFGSNEIHRDGGAECNQLGTPRPVYVFDPDFLAVHDVAVAAKALTDAAEEFSARLADGTGNGRAYNSYTVANMLRARAAAVGVPEEAEHG